MSKYEQAIKLLEMLSPDEFQQFTSSEFDDAIYTAIEALKRQMWIPANVLPEAEDEHGNSKDVLVVRQRYFKGKPVEGEVFMDVDYYNHELALWMGAPDPIIAWMPLPIYTD